MLHNMRGNSRVACIDAQMHQDVFIIGVDIDAKNTENVFSPDRLLPPNQKRGRVRGPYYEGPRTPHLLCDAAYSVPAEASALRLLRHT